MLKEKITPCAGLTRRDFYLIDCVNGAYLKQQSEDMCVFYKRLIMPLASVQTELDICLISVKRKGRPPG